MKRSWFGLILLIFLLVFSLYTSRAMVRFHDAVEHDLLRSARLAQHGDWEQASAAFRKAREGWEDRERFRAALADHAPVEDIDADFAAAQVYCAARERVSFPAACQSLARQVAAVGEAHALLWWNFL